MRICGRGCAVLCQKLRYLARQPRCREFCKLHQLHSGFLRFRALHMLTCLLVCLRIWPAWPPRPVARARLHGETGIPLLRHRLFIHLFVILLACWYACLLAGLRI